MPDSATRTSCLPPPSAIARGFIRQIQALPDYSLLYDFDTLRALLIDYVRQNYPDWRDFLEDTSGMMMLELIAYVVSMLGFRSDFLRSQGFYETISDTTMMSRLMQLVDEKFVTPAPSYLYQVDPTTFFVNARMVRTSQTATDELSIAPGTRVAVNTEYGPATFEIFELDSDFYPKYADAFVTGSSFTVINSNSLISDPPAGTTSLAPSRPWVLVEGASFIDTYVSNGSIDQTFYLTRSPLITDYSHNNFRTAMRLISPDGTVIDPEWKEVTSLASSEAEDKHYEIEWDGLFRGKVKFGNGVFGKVPPSNYTIEILYRVSTLGSRRVAAGRINVVVPAINASTGSGDAVRLLNFSPTIGGGLGDTLSTVKLALPSRIRRQGRLVSGEDFASFAKDFPGIGKAKAYLLNNDATGNLVRLRILESTVTSEGIARPYPGVNQTTSLYAIPTYVVTGSTYDPTYQWTILTFANNISSIISGRTTGVTGFVSANGVSRPFVNNTADALYSIKIVDDDVTNLFPVGTMVGLSLWNEFGGNVEGMTIKLPTSASSVFDIEGPGITDPDWPGDDSQRMVLQIDDEFITAQVEPAGFIGPPSTTTYATSSFTAFESATPQAFRGLNILERGYYGTQCAPHVSNSRVYLGGVRPDLYRAMNQYKVEPSEILIMEGKIVPLYLMLTIRLQSVSENTISETLRNALEAYFDFTNPAWDFGQSFRLSPILNIVQSTAGVASVEFTHATQYTINNTDDTQANYMPITVYEDITGVPDDSVIGLLPYKEAIGGIYTRITPTGGTYRLSSDILPVAGALLGDVTKGGTITLSLTAGSDFSLLPPAGIIKIKNEWIAYKDRDNNVLMGITRNVFTTAKDKVVACAAFTNPPDETYEAYSTVNNDAINLCPNIIMKFVTA